MFEPLSIGKLASLIVLMTESENSELIEMGKNKGYRVCKGFVGSMSPTKIFAAVDTAAKKEGLIKNMYREEHAIYHSQLEAYSGICRGQMGLNDILRTAGLAFSIVRGPRISGDSLKDEWIAVAFYGNMGAPIKGYEHEVIGLGINHI
jgi:hut operon positive regulatory protein